METRFERIAYSGKTVIIEIVGNQVRTSIPEYGPSHTALHGVTTRLAEYLWTLRVDVPAEIQHLLDAAGVYRWTDEEYAALVQYHNDHDLPSVGYFVDRTYREEILDSIDY